MKIFKLFRSNGFFLFLMLLGLLSSCTNLGMLMIINKALGGKTLSFFGGPDYLLFIGLMVVSFVVTALFQNYMIRTTNEVMFEMEMSIIQKVRRASFRAFETLGSERVYTAINDTRILAGVPQALVSMINSSFTIICSLIYLSWISIFGCLTILVIMTVLLLFYMYRDKSIRKDLNEVRDLQDTYYVSLRELLSGFKQIKISSKRNANLFNRFILENKKKSKNLTIKTSGKYVTNELMGTYSWYLVLGVVIFILPLSFKLNTVQVGAFITTILFMMSAVSQLVMFFPFNSGVQIALNRMDQAEKQLAVGQEPGIQEGADIDVIKFNKIRLENVVCKYGDSDKTLFMLDVADLEIRKGEIVFIEGANGSGKTTLIHVLTGLCQPVSGRILINGREVGWEEYCAFSNSMAVVFTDQHLFKENYDEHDITAGNGLVGSLREMFNLENVFRVDEARNRWDTKLSRGQEKRVALLLAMLEEKPIIILDEWAAEQDPLNRRFFYLKWLEEMRRMGKTVIAITHDDDYYHVADRVVKFDFGKLVNIRSSIEHDDVLLTK